MESCIGYIYIYTHTYNPLILEHISSSWNMVPKKKKKKNENLIVIIVKFSCFSYAQHNLLKYMKLSNEKLCTNSYSVHFIPDERYTNMDYKMRNSADKRTFCSLAKVNRHIYMRKTSTFLPFNRPYKYEKKGKQNCQEFSLFCYFFFYPSLFCSVVSLLLNCD